MRVSCASRFVMNPSAVFRIRFPLSPRLVVLPLLLAMAMALALAVGLLFSALQARFRDVANIIRYLVQFWFYATPVAYSASLVVERLPEPLVWMYRLNPMYGIVEGFRWALLGTGGAPSVAMLTSAAAILLFLVVSSMVFLRTEHSIVDLV